MDNIRDPQEVRSALQFLYDTDVHQLSAVIRGGPDTGKSKLLLSLTLSTDAILRFHYEKGDKGGGKGSFPSRTSDNSTSTDALHMQQQDATTTSQTQPTQATRDATSSSTNAAASSSTDTHAPPATSQGTAKGSAGADSIPSGQRGVRQVAPPAFTSAPTEGTCKISTRQLVCCREQCFHCAGLCGYASGIPNDSHFVSGDQVHLCKRCYREQKQTTSQWKDWQDTQWDANWHNSGSWWSWRW